MDEPSITQKLAAEALGTAFLVFIGVGSVPATIIVNGDAPFTMADLGMISFAFATVVVATIYALGHISGNHINPAVTLGLAATGKFPWSRVPAYIAAQVVGAIVGAAAIIGVLGMAARDAGLGVATYSGNVSAVQAFFAEFVGTFILVFTVFGVIHRKASAGFAGVAIGLVVFAAIIPVAPTTGASINPARTFGPMLVQQIAGGSVSWSQLPVYLAAECAGRCPRRVHLCRDLQDPGRRDTSPCCRSRQVHHRRLRSTGHEEADQRSRRCHQRGVARNGRRAPRTANRPDQPDRLSRRRADTRQGGADLRRRLRARTNARWLRRAGHARRGLCG